MASDLAPPDLPRWVSVAADSGFDQAIADSVAALLPATPAARAAWMQGGEQWSIRLVEPLILRATTRLHVSGALTPAQRTAVARRMAARVAVVRWGDDAGEELLLDSDSDVRAVLQAKW